MYPTTETIYGPAEFTVSADGALYLRWPQGLTLNRVAYTRAEAWQTVPQFGGSVYIQALLTHPDYSKEASSAARAAIRRELKRLSPLLVTPQAVAQARVGDAHDAAHRASAAVHQAQQQEAHALSVLAEAHAALMAAPQEGAA